MEWFIKANINIGLLFIIFKWIVQFSSNRTVARIFLLAIPLVAIAMSMFPILGTSNIVYTFTLPEVYSSSQYSFIESTDWESVLKNSYLVGIACSLLISALAFLRVCFYKPNRTAFSFFKFIHIPNTDSHSYQFIQLHEQAHSNYWHSVDILYYAVFRAVFWINPFAYILFKSLKQEHEFEADAYVIRQTNHIESYCELLVDQTFGQSSSQAIEHSFHSQYSLLNRLQMITQTQPQSISWRKRIATIPMLALLIGISLFQTEVLAQRIEGPVYQVVEQMPEFIGGQENMMAYFKNELKYPPKCRDQKIEGRVVLQFVVDKNGRIQNVRNVKENTDALLVAEAMRIVKAMPKWIPGKKNEQAVNVEVTLPIVFKL